MAPGIVADGHSMNRKGGFVPISVTSVTSVTSQSSNSLLSLKQGEPSRFLLPSRRFSIGMLHPVAQLEFETCSTLKHVHAPLWSTICLGMG